MNPRSGKDEFTAICVLYATDLLLHLIVHGAYEHHFDNGPLLFSDIAYLLENETTDWPLFWQLVRNTIAVVVACWCWRWWKDISESK